MPRRKRVKCPSKRSGPELDAVIEWCLTEWLGANTAIGCDFKELEDSWECHRETILKDWIEQLPGTRPFGGYAVGEFSLPETVATPYKNDSPYQTRDGWVFNYEAYFPTQRDEFNHLLNIGIVGDDERKRAETRFKNDDDWHHYKSRFLLALSR